MFSNFTKSFFLPTLLPFCKSGFKFVYSVYFVELQVHWNPPRWCRCASLQVRTTMTVCSYHHDCLFNIQCGRGLMRVSTGPLDPVSGRWSGPHSLGLVPPPYLPYRRYTEDQSHNQSEFIFSPQAKDTPIYLTIWDYFSTILGNIHPISCGTCHNSVRKCLRIFWLSETYHSWSILILIAKVANRIILIQLCWNYFHF